MIVDSTQSTTGLPSEKMAVDSRFEKCLAALRAELRVSYPKIRPLRLLWILKKHSLSVFPNSFLVAGKLFDLSRRGALANLLRYQRGRDGHVLFSRLFYEMAYPDIAEAGAPAWAHYQTRGNGELRSPHPLIDVPFLQAALDEQTAAPVRDFSNPLDLYLNNPERWAVNPSPFVDCVGFIMSGLWDGLSLPLALIVSEHLEEAWINQRLMLIDAEPAKASALILKSSNDVMRLRLICAGILFFRNYPASLTLLGRRWLAGEFSDLGESSGTFTVIPGFAVGRDSHVFLLGQRRLLSHDSSMITTDQICLGLERGVTHVTTTMSVIAGELTYSELINLCDSLSTPAIVAPFSSLQEQAIIALLSLQTKSEIVVLPWGQQAQVSCSAVVLNVGDGAELVVESWPDERVTPFSEIAIVLPFSDRARVHENLFVTDALSCGASLCLVVDDQYCDWLPVLSRRKFVVVDAKIAADLRSFVPDEKIRILPVANADYQK